MEGKLICVDFTCISGELDKMPDDRFTGTGPDISNSGFKKAMFAESMCGNPAFFHRKNNRKTS
jgi:hypothetical protein